MLTYYLFPSPRLRHNRNRQTCRSLLYCKTKQIHIHTQYTYTKDRTPKHIYFAKLLKFYFTHNHRKQNTNTATRYYKSRNRNATSGNRTIILGNKQTLCYPTCTCTCTQTRISIRNQFTHVYVPYAHQPKYGYNVHYNTCLSGG